MQWNVDWKIRGKTLSKHFWIFYAISILFFHPTIFLSSHRMRSVSRSPFIFVISRRATTRARERPAYKKNTYYLGGECLMWRHSTALQCQTIYKNYHFFSFALPFIAHTKTFSAEPTSKFPTMHLCKLDSQDFPWRDKKNSQLYCHYYRS